MEIDEADLEPETAYYARLKFISDTTHSAWSPTIQFTTAIAGVRQTSIKTPASGTINGTLTPTFVTDTFKTWLVPSDTHVATDGQIATDVNFTNIVYFWTQTTGDLTIHTVATPLPENTTLYVRVRHVGQTYGASPYWSNYSEYRYTTGSGFSEKIKLIGHQIYDDEATNVMVDSEGNIIIIGVSNATGSGKHQGYIAKLDSEYNLLAHKIFSNGNWNRLDWVLFEDANGDYLVGGRANGTNSEFAGSSAWILKLDKDFNVLQNLLYTSGAARCQSFAQLESGNYILGIHASNSYCVSILELDSNLAIVRKVSYGSSTYYMQGMIIDDYINSETPYYITTGHIGGSDAYIAKFDNNFNLVNHKILSSAHQDIPCHIIMDDDGNYVFCGWTRNSINTSYGDGWIVKFDKDLNLLISKTFGRNYFEEFLGMIQDDDGNYVCCGYSQENASLASGLIAKFDKNLNVIASRTLSSGVAHVSLISITLAPSGDYIATGYAKLQGESYNEIIVVGFPKDLSGVAAGLTESLNLTISDPFFTAANPSFTLSSGSGAIGTVAFSVTAAGTHTALDPTNFAERETEY
jgi:hypothetical protein